MPRVRKAGTFEAVWAADDEYIVNERTGKQGKCMAGKIRITKLESGERWYVEPAEFHMSGWEVEVEAEAGYFTVPPPVQPIGV